MSSVQTGSGEPSVIRPDQARKSDQKLRNSRTENSWNAPWSANRRPVRAAQKRMKSPSCETATAGADGDKTPTRSIILQIEWRGAPYGGWWPSPDDRRRKAWLRVQ